MFKKYLGKDLDGKISRGTCGECSRDISPDYCLKSGESYIKHQCDNGYFEVDNDDESINLCKALTQCTDSYGKEVYVDLKNNRYHCGRCENICGNDENCIKGVCQSIYHCSKGKYVKLDIGSRWVKAYCVMNIDDLKIIHDEINKGNHYPASNHDNAYILADDIDYWKFYWRRIYESKNKY